MDLKPNLDFKNLKELSLWLLKNHTLSNGAWVILYKKESKNVNFTYKQLVEELLCFGWIDSVPNKIDNLKYKIYISPRNPKSNWSRVNKNLVEKLLKENRMQPAGLKMVDLAKEKGTWSALDNVEDLILPNKLIELFNKNKVALTNFNNFSKSSKRGILEWVYAAKREETLEKRISEVVRLAEQNLRANFLESKGK